MNEVQLFNFESHEVRSLLINSEPLLRKMTIAELKERGFLRNES